MPGAHATPLNAADLEWFVRFFHPEKILALRDIPGAANLTPEMIGRLFGTSAAEYRRLRERFRAGVDRAAEEVVADIRCRRAARRLAARGGPIVALGDSLTDDYQSWAEILARVLALAAPDRDVELVNAGVGGDTSADALRRIGELCAGRPRRVMVMIGTNDARRQGSAMAPTSVSDGETARNLALIAAQAREGSVDEPVWLTPPPVLERRVAEHRFLSRWAVTYRNDEIAAKAALVRALGGPIVDVHDELTRAGADGLWLDDGVHLSLEGQTRIVTMLLDAFPFP